MSSAKVLVGIVGFGNMGRLHAEQLRYLPDVIRWRRIEQMLLRSTEMPR
jgi:prephenate dehydrogenase